jgi:hypothetical protein
MTKCPVCQKPKSEYEMRPLIDVKEIKVADKLTEESSEREVGGAKLQIVCRQCWTHILSNMTKEEVMEMMETLAGLILEMERRHSQQITMQPVGDMSEIEKYLQRPVAPTPSWLQINRFQPKFGPHDVIGIGPDVFGDADITYTSQAGANAAGAVPMWSIGTTSVDWTKFKDLGDEWASLVSIKP